MYSRAYGNQTRVPPVILLGPVLMRIPSSVFGMVDVVEGVMDASVPFWPLDSDGFGLMIISGYPDISVPKIRISGFRIF